MGGNLWAHECWFIPDNRQAPVLAPSTVVFVLRLAKYCKEISAHICNSVPSGDNIRKQELDSPCCKKLKYPTSFKIPTFKSMQCIMPWFVSFLLLLHSVLQWSASDGGRHVCDRARAFAQNKSKNVKSRSWRWCNPECKTSDRKNPAWKAVCVCVCGCFRFGVFFVTFFCLFVFWQISAWWSRTKQQIVLTLWLKT